MADEAPGATADAPAEPSSWLVLGRTGLPFSRAEKRLFVISTSTRYAITMATRMRQKATGRADDPRAWASGVNVTMVPRAAMAVGVMSSAALGRLWKNGRGAFVSRT